MSTHWMDDIREKYNRKNQILFSRESQCLQGLLELIRRQNHRTLVLWAFKCIEEPLGILNENYPMENRPDEAVRVCNEWARGEVKMPIAKQALLAVHAMAKDIADPADQALCHAVGQACATVHLETHAIGLAFYQLSSIVKRLGIENCEEAIEQKIQSYIDILQKLSNGTESNQGNWAKFLMDDSRPNKEQLLYEKSRYGNK